MVGIVFTLTALSFGAAASISVFLKPLTETFGWARSEAALGYTTVAMASAVFGVAWGVISDRVGSRWFGLVAALVMPACLWGLSQMTQLWQFYALYFLFGAFGNAMVSTPLFASVGFWFKRNPGLALGVMAAGGAVGQGVVPWAVAAGISRVGWQDTYTLMALVYLLVALPLALLVREAPARAAARAPAYDNFSFALGHVEVIAWISVAVVFCCNCMAVPIVHLVPLLTDSGKDPQVAASVLLVLMLSGGLGRIFGGKLADLIGALPAYMLMSLGQTVSVVWFPQFADLYGLYALAAFFGFTYSGVMTSILVCTRMMVPARMAGTAMSVTSFFGWIGMGMGGWLGGFLFDASGGYEWSYRTAGAMGVANLTVLALFFARIRSVEAGQPRPA